MFMLGDFIRILRAADLRISTAESLDAANALKAFGLQDKQLVKAALSQTLAKTDYEKQRFDMCFDDYFQSLELHVPPQAPPAPVAEADQSDTQSIAAHDTQAAPLADELHNMLAQNDQNALATAIARAAGQSGVQNAQLFTQQGLFSRRIAETMGIEALDRSISDARQADHAELMSALEQQRARLMDTISDYVERQIAMRTANVGRLLREDALSRIKLTNLSTSDMHIMRNLIKRLAKRLASLHARRKKKAQRGTVDIRRTLRHNQRNDGVLFDIMWKQVKVERPKLITLCDVSGSVASVARFLLMFLYSLDEVMPRTRSFAFSATCGEVTDFFETHTAEDAMIEIIRHFGSGSTDYGRALNELADMVHDEIDHRTTILILGDARSNYGDPGHLILKDMAQRAKRIIWLNPEVKALWNTGDSEMQKLGAYCTHVQVCNNIRHLEKVMDDLLRLAA